MTVSVNYAGRKIDLGIFNGVKSTGMQQMGLAFGTVTTGIQKLAQNVLTLLLSGVESDPYDEDFGCDFIIAAKTGQIRTDNDVESEFGIAASQIASYLSAAEQEDDPDDEKLDSLELTSYTFSDGYLDMTIQVTSLADDDRVVVLPVSIAIT